MEPTVREKIEVLKKIAHRFNEERIVWALGASMLLYFKGVASEFHDIDLMIALPDADRANAILSELGERQPPVPSTRYRTKVFAEYVIDGIDVDALAGFAVVSEGRLYDCSLREEQITEKMPLGAELIPLQSLTLWREYYRLMGKDEKAALIESKLANP